MNDIVRVDTERLRAHLEEKLPPKIRRFRLDDIPGVMRSRLGWPVAATLMERWFRGTAFEIPNTVKNGRRPLIDLNSAQLDESTVTMQWVVMKLSNLKSVPCIVWCLGLNAVFLAVWALATPTFLDAENSPHRVYRLEFHKASFLQRITHPSFKMPYVVRLYRIEPKTLLGQSEVVDLWLNGEIQWYLDPPVGLHRVHVGQDVTFENIPPECTEAAQIPGCPNTKP